MYSITRVVWHFYKMLLLFVSSLRCSTKGAQLGRHRCVENPVYTLRRGANLSRSRVPRGETNALRTGAGSEEL